ncbi:YIP1 family protein [Fictibacillus norfolkensis]|uniref:YIP1 family protein n=1 Tax=Fictibacillus norfolkensis TaxID=2762233 RepID=A0ABR8SI86_9BACL|nr:YIP1 family protein [Fictibacillus norfolkensis]MBD7963213.1 YIP1 family protein [Fictibacillus norfolkensis]
MKRIAQFVALLVFLLVPISSIASASVPYQTETLSADGQTIETQTAYTPVGTLLPDVEIMNPEDIFSDTKGNLYIADSGAKKILVADRNGKFVREIGKGVLKSPTGVYVDENEKIFVADYEEEKVFRFSKDGKVEEQYGKPDSPLFGKSSSFKPQKVAVDRRGSIYVISEGSTNGIIQLSKDGGFLGYYGVNSTEGSFGTFLQKLLTSESKKANMFMKTPPAPDNIALDDQGLVYSVTEGTTNEVIKKLNVAGKNMLFPDISDEKSLQDIAVDHDGNMFVVSSTGEIYEYDSFGNLLFIFGGKDDGTNRLGLFKQPTGITIDPDGRLYVTDKERGMIQVFESTAFSKQVHEGIALFKEGRYVESQKYWEEVLEMNSSFGLAHSAMGSAYYKQQDYDKALEEYQFANDVFGYSDSFWEVRHAWMQENLETVLFALILFAILYYIVKVIDKKKGILNQPRRRIGAIKKQRLIGELLFLFKFFRHPIDSFYYLKRKQYASILSATILYVILIVEYIYSRFYTGFIYKTVSSDANLVGELLLLLVPLALFIVVNYLVSTINDGEGRFKDIYIGTIYSLAPFLVFSPILTLLSNVLTYNEAFVYVFSIRIIYAWCLIILFIMLKEIHNYTFSDTIRNIFVTLFGMVIMLLVVFIVFVLIDQVYDFVYSIIKEAVLRV